MSSTSSTSPRWSPPACSGSSSAVSPGFCTAASLKGGASTSRARDGAAGHRSTRWRSDTRMSPSRRRPDIRDDIAECLLLAQSGPSPRHVTEAPSPLRAAPRAGYDRPLRVFAAKAGVRPQHPDWSVGWVFHRQIGLIRGGTRPTVLVHDGKCGANALRATIVGNREEPSGESRFNPIAR